MKSGKAIWSTNHYLRSKVTCLIRMLYAIRKFSFGPHFSWRKIHVYINLNKMVDVVVNKFS